MVSTSARNAGCPWFDPRSRHDRLLDAIFKAVQSMLCYLFSPGSVSYYKFDAMLHDYRVCYSFTSSVDY